MYFGRFCNSARLSKAMVGGSQSVGRASVVVRIVAAIPANYVFTSMATACLARLLWQGLGLDPANASVAATLASFAIFAVMGLTAFAMRSALKLWLWMGGAALAMGGALWLSLEMGGRL